MRTLISKSNLKFKHFEKVKEDKKSWCFSVTGNISNVKVNDFISFTEEDIEDIRNNIIININNNNSNNNNNYYYHNNNNDYNFKEYFLNNYFLITNVKDNIITINLKQLNNFEVFKQVKTEAKMSKIVIVDDFVSISKLFVREFERSGWEVSYASNGALGLMKMARASSGCGSADSSLL